MISKDLKARILKGGIDLTDHKFHFDRLEISARRNASGGIVLNVATYLDDNRTVEFPEATVLHPTDIINVNGLYGYITFNID